VTDVCNAATTLTSWHLMVTFFTLSVAQRLRFFEPKPIDARTVISFGLLNGISIGLLNLCLGFNSVGFYQVSMHPKCNPSALLFLPLNFTIDCFLHATDDQAGHHTLHHRLGNHLSEQEVKVVLQLLDTIHPFWHNLYAVPVQVLSCCKDDLLSCFDNLEPFSQSIKASLMVLLVGVGIASVTDLQLNLLGSIIAALTIAATCVGQIVSF